MSIEDKIVAVRVELAEAERTRDAVVARIRALLRKNINAKLAARGLKNGAPCLCDWPTLGSEYYMNPPPTLPVQGIVLVNVTWGSDSAPITASVTLRRPSGFGVWAMDVPIETLHPLEAK